RDCLDPRHERDKWREHGAPCPEASPEVEGSNSKPQDESKPSVPPDEGLGTHYSSLFFGDEEDPLNPGDVAQSGEESARYRGDDNLLPFEAFVDDSLGGKQIAKLEKKIEALTQQFKAFGYESPGPPRMPTPAMIAGLDPPLVNMNKGQHLTPLKLPGSTAPLRSGLEQGLRQAAAAGESIPGFSLMAFPVYDAQDQQGQAQRVHGPVSFKTLKELKTACAQYGATAPFTLAQFESLCAGALTPWDWKTIARACLSGGSMASNRGKNKGSSVVSAGTTEPRAHCAF
ncbi:uncharacterized protein LOC120615493, partial [Pteropus medius]|uniref:uncharacterized protein LOC120615493 n=1 Tax=Pteropus vampyrus TaxID=132908 RepID=UPI00196A4A44